MTAFSIHISENDFVAAERLSRRGRRWPPVALAILGAGAVLASLRIAVALTEGEPIPEGALKIAGFCWLMAVYIAYLMTDISARRAYRKENWRTGPIRYEWSPDGMVLDDGHTTLRYAWRELRKWTEDSESLVVFTRGSRLRFPKRAIPSPALDELRGHLAEGGSTADRPPASSDARRWVEITEADFAAFHIAKTRPAAIGVTAVVLMLAGGATAVWLSGEDRLGPAMIGGWLLLAFSAWVTIWGLKRGGRRVYRRLRNAGEPFEIAWWTDGFAVRGSTREGRGTWDEFRSVRETPELLIARAHGGGHFLFPKRGLMTAELDELRAYLPKSHR